MSIEEALIAQARPHMFAAKARSIVANESFKGCSDKISLYPVVMEPLYIPINNTRELLTGDIKSIPAKERFFDINNLVRRKIWISPLHEFSWKATERFLKQLQSVSQPVGFEIRGNEKKIDIGILCDRCDVPIIESTFKGEFEYCELTSDDSSLKITQDDWETIEFRDYFPSPPYSHLLTCSDELSICPYKTLLFALSKIPDPGMGFVQVIFQPVDPRHNWHRNIQVLLDLEYNIKLTSGMNISQRFQQQAPSGDLRQMAMDVETKAHNDKPFYAVSLRIGVLGENTDIYLKSLTTFSNLFQHGGRLLNALTEKDYLSKLSIKQIQVMFLYGLTYRPGFLLNSKELSGLVHIPPYDIFENHNINTNILEKITVQGDKLSSGTYIGNCNYTDIPLPIFIPSDVRSRHTHVIGRTGMGKTTLLETLIVDDAINKENGVVIIDPHGDLIYKLSCYIPKEHVKRTIYLNPGDPEWVPLWNPLKKIPDLDNGRIPDDLVSSIKNVVEGWGDRLENLLKYALGGLIELPNTTLLDAYNLLQKNSVESTNLKKEIQKCIANESARGFWKYDFENYSKKDLGPPKHKLSKLLASSETVSLMLSQPEQRINFRRIMDDGMILLVDLSTIGSELRNILGGFMISLFHLAALGRSNIPKNERKPFHIYCDEAHRFVTDSLEDLIAETRKFNVCLTLANQYLSQFGQTKVDAISNVGSTIVFNVDTKDARHLVKDFRDKAKVEDIIALDVGDAIVRVGTEVVRIKTPIMKDVPIRHYRDQIIKESRRLYYKPVYEVRKIVKSRSNRWNKEFEPLSPHLDEEDDEGYDYAIFK